MAGSINEYLKSCLDKLEELKIPGETFREIYACLRMAMEEAQGAQNALNLHRAFMENVRDGVILIRLLDRTIIDANEAAARLYGYSREELISKNIAEIRAPAFRDEIKEQMTKAAREGMLLQTEHMRKDGSLFPVEVSASGLILNGEKVVISIIRDISDRRKVELALKESESRLHLIIENSPDRIFQQDENLRYTWYSGAPVQGMPFT